MVEAAVSGAPTATLKVGLINVYGQAFTADISLTKDFKKVEIPLSSLTEGDAYLLPRPYPGFQPLLFTSSANSDFKLEETDKLQVMVNMPAGTEKDKQVVIGYIGLQ